MKRRYIDLSHSVINGEVTYKGLPAPIICDYLSREESRIHYNENTSFQIGKIELISNTGTYIDCPFHRYEDGKDTSSIELNQLSDLSGILINVSHLENVTIGPEFFYGYNLTNKAVLIYTAWSDHWQTDQYFENYPFLNSAAAEYLRDQKVLLVGIDSYNIDDTNDKSRPVHTILLRNEILIVEHLTNLKQIVDQEFSFTAVPPKVKGFGTFPVRAFATINN